MKKLVLGVVLGIGISSSPVLAGGVEKVIEKGKIGIGVYFKNSEMDEISPSGIGLKSWGGGNGFQFLYEGCAKF